MFGWITILKHELSDFACTEWFMGWNWWVWYVLVWNMNGWLVINGCMELVCMITLGLWPMYLPCLWAFILNTVEPLLYFVNDIVVCLSFMFQVFWITIRSDISTPWQCPFIIMCDVSFNYVII